MKPIKAYACFENGVIQNTYANGYQELAIYRTRKAAMARSYFKLDTIVPVLITPIIKSKPKK